MNKSGKRMVKTQRKGKPSIFRFTLSKKKTFSSTNQVIYFCYQKYIDDVLLNLLVSKGLGSRKHTICLKLPGKLGWIK